MGHVVPMGERRGAYRAKDHLEDLSVNGRIILK